MASRSFTRFTAVALTLAGLAGCAAKQPEAPATATPEATAPLANANQLESFFRNKANVPRQVPITVSPVRPSTAFAGLKEGALEIGQPPKRQTVPFVITADGHWAMFGTPQDVTVDLAKEARDQAKSTATKINLEGQPFRGPADAKVTIVEYSDFQCPYCSRGYDTVENEVLKRYEGKVKFYYKHYPLPFHPWAEPAAVAAECAKRQSADAFWAAYRGFFEHQGDINPENLKAKSQELLKGTKIDMAKWNKCFDDRESLPEVKAQAAEASSIGVSGTPAFFINGESLSGAQPFESFQQIIEPALAPEK